MRSGWLVMLGWAAVFVVLPFIGWATLKPGDKPAELIGVGYLAWTGMGATAAVMLTRGAGATYGWAVERWVLKGIAFAGLTPLFLALLFVGCSLLGGGGFN